jgi:ABC-type amino acid transport substrate-binding protein
MNFLNIQRSRAKNLQLRTSFWASNLLHLLVLSFCLSLSHQAHAQTTRLERVLANKELRACIWPEYYSISYRNAKKRELSGIDIAITKDLAWELGVKLQYVDSNFAQLYESLEQDRCDIATHAIGISEERQARLLFSQSYLKSGLFAVTLKNKEGLHNWDSLDQSGRVIAVAAGTIVESVMSKSLKKARLLKVQPPGTREQEVLSGRADAFMTDYPYSLRMIDLTDWAAVIPAPSSMITTEYAYAFAKGDHSLQMRVDAFLSRIKKNGRLLQFAKTNNLEPIVLLK